MTLEGGRYERHPTLPLARTAVACSARSRSQRGGEASFSHHAGDRRVGLVGSRCDIGVVNPRHSIDGLLGQHDRRAAHPT